ncbi:MAG: hypothetical protein KAR40_16965 [Candidatus Sabulitectum sp.]|nr:hypothetical protein [Candidatus Sabulitectum sp.]
MRAQKPDQMASQATAWRAFLAVFIQFIDPATAYGYVIGKDQNKALAGAAAVILFIGFTPFILQGGGFTESNLMVPTWILIERIILASAAGLAVYILSFAMGGKKPLWPAVTSSFLSMGAFMVLVAFLAFLAYLFSFPGGFSWSFAEGMMGLPATRLSVFLVLFAARLDLASLATVYLWGRGLSVGWNETTSFGQRLAWTIYLFGILLLTLPVFIAPDGAEGGL